MKHFIIPGVLLLFISTANLTAQWVQIPDGITEIGIFSITSKGNNLFAASRSEDNYNGDGRIYMSTNYGTNWVYLNQNGTIVASDNTYIYYGKSFLSSGGGIFRSTDNGATWNFIGPPPQQCIRSLAVNGNYIYSGSRGCGQTYYVFAMTTNNGTSWNFVPSLSIGAIGSIALNGSNVFAGGFNLYRSTDYGLTWGSVLPGIYAYSIAINGNNIFTGTFTSGIYKSTDNGATWNQTSITGQYVRSMTVSGNNIFAGTNLNGVYVSNDNGASWTQRNEGLTSAPITALYILNGYIYAGTFGFRVYRRSLNELVGINPVSGEVPVEFALYQNYPNPFNPKSKIKFQISKLSEAKLIIYDILGREIQTLVNEQLQPGTYEVEFDAANYPSGVYYYKLIAGDYTDSKKMVLLR